MDDGCTDRDELHLKVADDPTDPFHPHGIALQQAEQPEALDPANVEAHRRRARTLIARPEHVGAERLVARLRLATG